MICKPTLINLSVGDVVTLTISKLGFSSKEFLITSYTLNENLTVSLTLQEYSSTVYDYNSASNQTTITSSNNINLPSAFTVQAPTTLVLDDELRISSEGILVNVLTVSATESDNAFVGRYECQFKKSTDSTFIDIGIGTQPSFEIVGVQQGITYDVRIRAISSIGVKSSFLSGQHSVVGESDPPSDVTDFSCNILGQEAHLSWTAVADLDLAFYQIRFSEKTDGTADWQDSVNLVTKLSRPGTSVVVPSRAGTYLIKAVDKSGNFSSNATAIISNVASVTNFNAVATQSEHPDFLGTLTNTVITDNAIELDSSELFDSASGNFDDETTRFFDSGVANADFLATGNYEFANVIDIGAKHTARITASLTQTSDNPDDLFDNRSGLFDSATSNFDGDTPANCDAHLEIATSDDNVTYTSFQNFVIGNYTARFFKFRVVLTSSDLASTPVVSAVTVTVDMEDRIFSGNDIVSGTGTKSITFTNPFKSSNYAVGVTGQSMATGDYFTVSNKTINGFDVAFFNSSNTGVSKTFDFLAKGF
jgi:predicted phage tail protein